MTPAEILAVLKPWAESKTRSAWRPMVEECDAAPQAPKFGGLPWINADAPWPNCGLCQLPLTPVLQLDLDQLPAEVNRQFGTGLLQLFYCVRDQCQGSGGWSPFDDDLSRVRVTVPTGSSVTTVPDGLTLFPAKSIVGWEKFDDFPSCQEHESAGLKHHYNFNAGTIQLLCPEVNLDTTVKMRDFKVEEICIAEMGDKLLGWPSWMQTVDYPTCPICQQTMRLLFQIDSEQHVPFMWGDMGIAHITQCPQHLDVVAFGWACG